MFFASLAFSIAFTHKDYLVSGRSLKVYYEFNIFDQLLLIDILLFTLQKSENEESRPFLSALVQSSVPDDVWNHIRRLALGSQSTPQSTVKKSAIVSESPIETESYELDYLVNDNSSEDAA